MLTNDNIAHLGDVERGEGTIRRLVTDRGFGFIRPTRANGTTRKDLFFHAAQVMGIRFEDLREGDTVNYAEEQDLRGRGPVATSIERTARVVMNGDATPMSLSSSSASPLAEDDDNVYDWGEAG